ncbi:fungal-specific transcription factor domain-containing protein [Microdochium trichocladiopsis]|uniref:Fungal-specific transcription factor domain-containing protein n=1 Tax=Microdochium trichocladiopsis TaxID=1682393 RepID=A0A9P8Y746_9PEZI|nr:fungal-specific transcription factor domain-containing protein [Microdochium trichocladiopsis]KAH7031494.1 fungal-specific transcription factor domain-containing protein [Microdochium trichocladiopsis]
MEPDMIDHGCPGTPPAATDLPSCQGCRRRKLRCSREQPVCTHCSRLAVQCVYDTKKNKPGIRLGAVESLNRRLVDHHAIQRRNSYTANAPNSPGSDDAASCVVTASSTSDPLPSARLTRPKRRSISHGSILEASPGGSACSEQPRKRQRLDNYGTLDIDILQSLEALRETVPALPASEVMRDVATAYFNLIQPWIPILHKTGFWRQLHDPDRQAAMVPVLHAMVVAALRLVDNIDRRIPAPERNAMIEASRNAVMLEAMNNLSVENLQALSIIAFTDIGNGDTHKAWSVVGSLTRTAEYLQLSIEPDQREHEPLLRPLSLLAPCRNWTEEEERRRVFWTIFCLDSRWNISLTSADVQRRLPADGGLWHKEDAVVTPYFGIWDRSAAKIGNSIAFMPSHYASPDQTTGDSAHSAVPPTASTHGAIDMSTVGAFAYRVEATESLSRITTYFLQQKISFKDRQELSDWLIRFKELDLRLVHWKMFLPQKWRDSNISRQPALINMDPNLTLAHITHNTSMILLHQAIAFPHPTWVSLAQLPSLSSADTCQEAATETCTIMEKYLRYTPKNSLASSQFSFCVFISARVLLVRWRHYQTTLAPEFWKLLDGLDELAQRWAGASVTHVKCISGTYARQLRHLHAMCQADPNFTIDVLGYTNMLQLPSSQPGIATGNGLAGNETGPRARVRASPRKNNRRPNEDIVARDKGMQRTHGNASTIMTESLTTRPDDQTAGLLPGVQLTPTQHDDLSAISHMLMEEQFLSMDRVISFDDMMFTAQTVDEAFLPWASTGLGHSWPQ